MAGVYKLTIIVVDWLYLGNSSTVLHPGFTSRYKDAGMFGSTHFIFQTTAEIPYIQLITCLRRLAAVCALSEGIMNKGQLTALIVGGAQVKRVVLHDALSSGL